jgi:hypothetical protein
MSRAVYYDVELLIEVLVFGLLNLAVSEEIEVS